MTSRGKKLQSVVCLLAGLPMASAPVFAPDFAALFLDAAMLIPGMPDLFGIGAFLLMGAGFLFSFVLCGVGFAMILISLRRLFSARGDAV